MQEETRKQYKRYTKKQLIDEIDHLWTQRDLAISMLLDEHKPTRQQLIDMGFGLGFINDLNRKGLTDKYLDV